MAATKAAASSSSRKRSMAPHFAMPDSEVAASDLFGFDVAGAETKLAAWLDENRRRTDVASKAAAIANVLRQLAGMRAMWVPERIADRRWASALREARGALQALSETAALRAREQNFIASRATGNARVMYGKQAERARMVATAARALERRIRDSETLIDRFQDDLLQDLDSHGRPVNGHQKLTHLGHEELTHPRGIRGRVALTS